MQIAKLGRRLKDGGSQEVLIKGISYWIDGRIKSHTKGRVYRGMPGHGELASPITSYLVIRWYKKLIKEAYGTNKFNYKPWKRGYKGADKSGR